MGGQTIQHTIACYRPGASSMPALRRVLPSKYQHRRVTVEFLRSPDRKPILQSHAAARVFERFGHSETLRPNRPAAFPERRLDLSLKPPAQPLVTPPRVLG